MNNTERQVKNLLEKNKNLHTIILQLNNANQTLRSKNQSLHQEVLGLNKKIKGLESRQPNYGKLNHIYDSMCKKKKSFNTKGQAIKTAEKFDKNFSVYNCPFCHCWHITTKDNFS